MAEVIGMGRQAEKFDVGDVVYFKSGSPSMTISDIDMEEKKAQLVWFEDCELKTLDVPLVVLTHTDPNAVAVSNGGMSAGAAIEALTAGRRVRISTSKHRNPDGSIKMGIEGLDPRMPPEPPQGPNQ